MMQSSSFTCFVFNGDADGLIGQHLMGLSGTTPSLRVTGLKREITLLDGLPSFESGEVYVFDISLDANRKGLLQLLEKPEVKVTWFDHHESGKIPDSPQLQARILNTRGTCTALLVHAALPGSDPRWAAMAAFGDNVPEAGEALLRPLQINDSDRTALREAGEMLNYNAYGETARDVLFQPLKIAECMQSFRDPVEFVLESGLIEPLRNQFHEDELRAQNILPYEERESARIYMLPAEPWARRLGATFANKVSVTNPRIAVAVLHPLFDGSYRASIRAPRSRQGGLPSASDFALEFSTGGGRASAAGVNRLLADDVPEFLRRFFESYSDF